MIAIGGKGRVHTSLPPAAHDFFAQLRAIAPDVPSWPALDTKYKVEDEERPENDETDEVDPRPLVAHRVADL